jgi:hypothetical protein
MIMLYPNKSHRSTFLTPSFSIELAEFCGILLGDGGIYKYQTKITLHADEEKEYGKYVHSLIYNLFGISAGIQNRNNLHAIDIVISRIGIGEFLTQTCGLKSGNKIVHQIDIPSWIRANSQYLQACIRGLIDTDGSIFTHKYISRGKEYSYKKLSFTSASKPLLYSVRDEFIQKGLSARIGSNKDVRLDSKADMALYFDIFGSNNPKHLKRWAR